ncbi:oxygen-dependent protoporphyrinogen oxidase [Purpureocillium lilacinum]|uniref:Protoporphyrinogen oxidase n=1 Tax=Purpureocillium lilacinum TaxID=33203 RepID=A0A179GU72_PURLI|nr:protoporphyrinogen oxidase [Purpureocillium lilacinum]GJN72925.1 oxygen-dependent protoporphyrinogen oxidase [Purpureocillium lilacinum]GJN83442.1 oxygen-dependent protoporphyrinogen oxidase [Purpureocillium lilacinum]
MGRGKAEDAAIAVIRLAAAGGRPGAAKRGASLGYNVPRSRRMLSGTSLGRPQQQQQQQCCLARGRTRLSAALGASSCVERRASYATATHNDSGKSIAVVGGGLTGLTTAYYLAKQLPASARITLYEGSDRLGGWIWTDRVEVDVDGTRGTVGFERGPRTLSSLHLSTWRFDDLVLYDLALDLGLKIETPPDKPRYIFYPDHLVTLPPAASLAEFVREPLFLESFWAGLGFLFRRLTRSRSRAVPLKDMSISEWLRDISMSRSVGDNIASAMVHGIYGGDIDLLSARSVFDRLYWGYYLPNMGPGVRQMTAREEVLMSSFARDPQIRSMALKPKGSLLHFGGAGMESLPLALADALEAQPNVEIRKGSPVSSISYDKEAQKVEISTARDQEQNASPATYDRVISTVSSQDLARATGDKLPSLADTHSVSIWTVNVWYPRTDLKPPGFGYLIPRSVPREHNPERALGVFFDSDVGAAARPDEPPGTKLFVLLGGHYYDSGPPPPETEADAIAQAKALLERHLDIPASTPCFAMARFAKECIPQHYVGHHDRMMQADQELRDGFDGRLAVAGGSYSKIGAMGALRAGYDVATQTTAGGEAGNEAGWFTTGLEHLEFPEPFVGVPVGKIPVRRFKQLK